MIHESHDGERSSSADPYIEATAPPNKCDSIESSGWCVSAVGASEQRHHFVERGNVELPNRASVFQPVAHRVAGIEQISRIPWS